MGLLSCFKPAPGTSAGQRCDINKLTSELAFAQGNVAQLKAELLQLQSERVHLLHELSNRPETPSKQDAGTDMPTVSVAVQVKPPVTMESRIPRPTGEDPKEADGSKSPIKSRIPAAPVAIPAVAAGEPACCSPAHSPAAARTGQLSGDASALTADTSAVASPKGVTEAEDFTSDPTNTLGSPKGQAASHWQSTNDTARSNSTEQQLQRIEVLQQQLKVAEAFRQSLEAELRDVRFANNNLHTQMLNLQTKFEKTVEAHVSELERFASMHKEGQDSHEQAAQQVKMLRRQLSLSKNECTAALRGVEAAAKQAAAQEQKLQQSSEVLEQMQQKLSSCVERLAAKTEEADSLAVQLQDAQKQVAAAEAHAKQLDDELKAQKALYDSTVDEMLSLNTNYNELKQSYHKLQSETKQHDEMAHLVQQELSQLSYYAAAGKVALGLAPASTLQSMTPRESQVCMSPEGVQAIEGTLAQLSPMSSANLAASAAAHEAAGIMAEEAANPAARADVTAAEGPTEVAPVAEPVIAADGPTEVAPVAEPVIAAEEAVTAETVKVAAGAEP